MRSAHRSTLLLSFAALSLVACSNAKDGPSPTIAQLSPMDICDAQQNVVGVKIQGSGFSPIVKNVLAGSPAVVQPTVVVTPDGAGSSGGAPVTLSQVDFVSASEIDITIPMAALAPTTATMPQAVYDITVTNPDGHSASKSMALTVWPPPTLTMVAPSEVCDKLPATLTLTGTNFRTGATVTIGMTALSSIAGASVSVASPTSITVSLPAMALPDGTYGVTVTDPELGSCSATLGSALTIAPPPTVTSILPNSGTSGQSETVTIMGTGFLPGATASLAMGTTTVPLSGVTVNNVNQITATANLTGVAAGIYDVFVKNADGCSDTLVGGFTVLPPKMLGITSIEPPFGCTCSDTPVTITGSGFVSTPTITMVPHGATTPVTALKRIAFVSSTTLTAVVPSGLALGAYDVTITNPPSDGAIGTLASAFTVVLMPIPTICAVTPAQGNTSANTNVTITGANFRSANVELIDATGTPVTGGGVSSVTTVSSTQITATFDTMSAVPVGAYLVRVIDTDESTFSDYANFVNTNPSGKLSAWGSATSLATARDLLAGVAAGDDVGNKFVYALGGFDATNTAQSTVEVSPLSKFGNLGSFFVNGNAMKNARAGVSAVAIALPPTSGACYSPTTYVYVLGGTSDGATPIGAIERAVVLRNADAPILADPTTNTAAGMLAAGTWYYKVSAVLSASDPENPGETLPSDEAIATLSATGEVSLSWTKVAVNGVDAIGYRIYRTASADGVSQQEEFLTTTGTATLTYTDDGSATPSPSIRGPLQEGSLGVFVPQGSLVTARFEAPATLAHDATGAPFVFIAGGRTGAAAGTIVSSVEAAPVSVNGTLGSFASAGNLSTGVANFALFDENQGNVSTLPSSSGDVLWAWGGEASTGAVFGGGTTSSLQSASLGSGSAVVFAGNGLKPSRAVGGFGVNVNGYMFVLGGGGSIASERAASVTAGGQQASFGVGGALVGPFSSTSSALPGPRAEGAIVVGSGFLYVIGGQDGTGPAAATYQAIN